MVCPFFPEKFRAELISPSVTSFHFVIPSGIAPGLHSVSFWSGDATKALTFLFKSVDVLQPKLIRLYPSSGSTAGGELVSVSVMNFEFDHKATIFIGTSRLTSISFYCQSDPNICAINAVLPPTTEGVYNLSLVSQNSSYIVPQPFIALQPVPMLDYCFPVVGLVSGGTRVTCYFLNIASANSLSISNVTGRFSLVSASVSSTNSIGSVFAVVLVSPPSVFEGNVTLHIRIATSMFSFSSFAYVRPCNFETFCPSRGLIPFDLRIIQQPVQDDACSDGYCIDAKTLPIPSIDFVAPSVVSTVGGSQVTLFCSNLLAIVASDISVSLASTRSPDPVAATVLSYDFSSSDLTFVAPSLPLEGLYVVTVSTRRSRQLLHGIRELSVSVVYETPIVGKSFIGTIFPTIVPHNTGTAMFVTLRNFVPVFGTTARVLFSANQSADANICQVLFSSRSSTFVKFELPAFAGPALLNLSIWNSMISQSRSADIQIDVEAPPIPEVTSVFPDAVEAASNTGVSLQIANAPSSIGNLFVRTKNGTFVANVSIDFASISTSFCQFLLPKSRVSGTPLLFDRLNVLEIASFGIPTFTATFSLYVSAPAKPKIVLPPRFTSLLTTESPVATFVLLNFGDLSGPESVASTLTLQSTVQFLAVTSYQSSDVFGTVSVRFPSNIRVSGPAEVTIFSKAAGPGSCVSFAFTYVFPSPIVTPSHVCTNGKSSGSIILYAAFPSSIQSQNFQVLVNRVFAQVSSVVALTLSSVNITITFPSSIVTGSVSVDVTFLQGSIRRDFVGSVVYFSPPSVQSVSVTEISTLNRALLPVKVTLKDFPGVGNLLFSITARPFSVFIDSSEQSTYDSIDRSVITFFAPIGPPSGRLKFEIACTDATRFPPSVLEFLVVSFDITYLAPMPSIISIVPSAVDMAGGARVTITAQYLKIATSNHIIFAVGSRFSRNISVIYSDEDATFFVATVPSSDSPGVVQATVSHSLDTRSAAFLIRYTGRQTAECLQNCVASASQGSVGPMLVRLRFFAMVFRANQLSCVVSTLSTCSVAIVNSTSITAFIEIKVGPASNSERFESGELPSAVTVSSNEDSAAFQITFLRSPIVLSANFLTETSFRVVFDQSIWFPESIASSCDQFQNAISLFGRGAFCRFSRQILTVSGGPSFSLLPGDIVTLVPGLIFGSTQVEHSLTSVHDSASGNIAVMAPVRLQDPSVLFVAPSSVGPCDDLELRIVSPTPRTRYTWICLNDNAVTASAKARFIDARSVKFRSSDLSKVNFGYQFVLSATSIFSQSANSSVFEVFKLSQAVPNIISSRQSTLITVPVIVTAQVEFSACPVKSADMVFEWTASDSNAALSNLLKAFTSSTIMIPERFLAAGQSYTLFCSVFKLDEPSKKSVGTYIIDTIASPLQASLTGGGRVVSVQSDVTIDASGSYDPDFSSFGIDANLQFLWQCLMKQGDVKVPCRDANNILLNFTSNRVLRFPPDFLIAGTTYEFIVNVFKSGRSAVAVTAIQIANGLFVDDAYLLLSSQSRVNADEKFSIICKSSTVILSYQWYLTEIGSTTPFRFTNIDPSGQSLLLAPGTLSPGKDYEVAAIVTAKNRQPTKLNLAFSVNSAPSSGVCYVNPSEGVASVTAFLISCDGWVDVDGGIKYEVIIPDDSGKLSRYALDMSRPMYLSPNSGRGTLNLSVAISDKYACETRYPLSVRLSLPPPLPAAAVGNSCKSLAQLGKHLEYAQCIDSNFAVQGDAALRNSSRSRSLLSDDRAGNITLMRAAVLQKVASAADQAPLGVETLSRSYLQTITPLCSGGDLGTFPTSLQMCYSLLSQTSRTLLSKPLSTDASNNIVGTAAGILASFAFNTSQPSNVSVSSIV